MPHSTRSEPQIVFFDAVGTLFHLPRGVGFHYREVALRHKVDLSAEMLDRAFRETWKAAIPPETTRVPRPDDDRGWWKALVGNVLDRCEAPPVDRESLFADLYEEFALPEVWQMYPEVEEVLGKLLPRIRVGIISNFDGRLRPILSHLGLASTFQPIVISSEVGAEKPDPWIFTRAAELAAVRPEHALHVGDERVSDWEGAAGAGLQSFPLDRPRNSLRELLPQLGL